MDYQRDKWNHQTYIKHCLVLPKKADPLIIYLLRLRTPQETLKWQHISANIYSSILFLNTVVKIFVISWYTLGRNERIVPFLSMGENIFITYDLSII